MKRLRFLMPVGLLALAAGFSAVVMLLWNWLMPSIFGLVAINFWQALGLLVLARILFGGFGHGRKMMHGGMMHRMHHSNPIREKWMKMSDEERKKFLEERREHACGHPFEGRGFFNERGFDIESGNSPKDND